MKKLYTKFLIFSALGAALLPPLKYFAETAGETFKEAPLRIVEMKRRQARSGEIAFDKNKTNVVFMGDSRVLFGLDPARFDAAAGADVFSYNFSLPALPIGPHYFLLSDLLASGARPDYIIIAPEIYSEAGRDLFERTALHGMASAAEMWSYFFKLKNRNLVLNYFFPLRMYEKEAARYAKALISDRGDIERTRAFNARELEKIRDARGYYFADRPHGRRRGTPPELLRRIFHCGTPGSPAGPYSYPYVKMFFDLAEKNGIKVIIITPPYIEDQCTQYDEIPAFYSTLLKDYGNVFMAENGWKRKFYPEKLFSDPLHVSSEGAARYTDDIAREFREIRGR